MASDADAGETYEAYVKRIEDIENIIVAGRVNPLESMLPESMLPQIPKGMDTGGPRRTVILVESVDIFTKYSTSSFLSISPERIFRKVDFPAPLAPMTP